MPEKPGSGKRKARGRNRYDALIVKIFRSHYRGKSPFDFERSELETMAVELGIELPKNLGDLIYSFRYRKVLPPEIADTAPAGKEWTIEPAGRSRYRFRLAEINRITPREGLLAIKIPDATPEIIAAYSLTDEQALLAKVRYNRLVDVFLGITAYSLQNHLRTTVTGIGQIEIDEVYIGINRNGGHFVVPIQAKGGADRLGAIQTHQDFAWCREKFPNLRCRPVSAQFLRTDDGDNVIAMFELTVSRGEVRVVEERHYRLVPGAEISADDLARYNC